MRNFNRVYFYYFISVYFCNIKFLKKFIRNFFFFLHFVNNRIKRTQQLNIDRRRNITAETANRRGVYHVYTEPVLSQEYRIIDMEFL